MTYESLPSDDARIDIAAILRAIGRSLPRIILVTLLLLAAAFVFLMFQTRLYESSASILVEPRSATEQTATIINGNAAGVVSSQIELIKSRDTLIAVVDQLDLRSVAEFNGSQSGFSPLGMIMQMMGRSAATPNSVDDTVIRTLSGRLGVSQEGDSGIITVSARSSDPQLAADIANAVANTHVSRRAGLTIADTAVTSGWLEGEIERLRTSVTEAESAVADFRVNNDLYLGGNNTSLLDQQLSTIFGQISAAQERQSTAQSRAALINSMIERGQPIEGLTDVQSSAIIQQLTQEKARVQGELAQRSATLLASHPTIRSLNAQVAELNGQIRIEGQRVAAALQAEAQVQGDLVTSLQAELTRSKATASTATRDTVTLDSLEREAAAQRDLLEAYLLRYNEASSRVEANSALPDVRVVSEAAPSVTPASPQTTLVMAGVGFVSIAVQIGLVAFSELMSGRALSSPSRPLRQDELEAVPFSQSELEADQRPADAEFDEVAVHTEPVIPPVMPPAAEPQPETAREFIRSVMTGQATAESIEEPVMITDEIVEEEMPVAQPLPAPVTGIVGYPDLVSDLTLGRTHLLLLADHSESEPSRMMAEALVGSAIGKGLSVALIDGAGTYKSDEPGLTELAAGRASFGDVVQKATNTNFAEVNWGQGASLDTRSTKPLTLIEALSDIYEVVVIMTGRVDAASTLSYFAELGGRVVLVTGDETEVDLVLGARRTLEEAGLANVEIVAMSESVAA